MVLADGLPALIKYEMVPTLEHLAHVSTIHSIWDYREMKKLLVVRPNVTHHTVIRQLSEKFRNLNLPNRIFEKMMEISYQIITDIVEWVRYHDDQIFNVGPELELLALHHIDLIVWTPGGNIDYVETGKKLILLDFPHQVKFRIAYAYCLEDDMKKFTPDVLEPGYMRANFPEHGRDFLPRSSLYYWISYKILEFHQLSYDYSSQIRPGNEDFLFSTFLRLPNYALSHHLWLKLTTDERIERVIEMVNGNVKPDLQIYFLSMLNKEEQEMVINCSLPRIFKIFVTDCRVRDFYGSVMQYMWENMSVQDFLEIMKFLYGVIEDANSIIRRKCRQIFKNFWNDAPSDLKGKILQNQYNVEIKKRTNLNEWYPNTSENIVFSLNWIGNEDLIEMIMSDATPCQKKYFITVDSALSYGILRIKRHQWDHLEIVLRRMAVTEEDLFDYKKALLRHKDYHLVEHFLQTDNEYFEFFYTWCFKSSAQKETFMMENRQDMWMQMKRYFSQEKNLSKVEPFLKWCMIPENEYPIWLNKFKIQMWHNVLRYRKTILDLEYFLNWSFKTEKKVYRYRQIIPSQTHLLGKFICTLMKKNDFELINHLLNWCFLFDQIEIQKFKNNFFKICEKNDFLDVIDFIAVTRNDDFQMFISFFRKWFVEENEFEKFKQNLVKPKTSLWIGADFVRRKKFEAADKFFKFCGNMDDEQMERYKNTIFLDDGMKNMLRDYKHVEHLVPCLKQWVNPTNELYEKFRYKFFYQF